MTDVQEGPVRSLHNDFPTSVTFINRSTRTIHLFWIDFKGKLVRYGRIPPQKGVQMNTYETHPWIANDVDTMYPLLLNGERIFFPTSERNGNVFNDAIRDTVEINIPVYSLVRRCLEVVYKTNQQEMIKDLNIPTELKEALLRIVPRTDFKDYKHFDSMWYGDFGRRQEP